MRSTGVTKQGTELRDPSMKEVSDYYARLVSWYTQGGFTDELGRRHDSGHHYKIDYWEILNEPEYEHAITPQTYTRLYDAVVTAIRHVNPQIKFVGMSLATPSKSPEFLRVLSGSQKTTGLVFRWMRFRITFMPSPPPTRAPIFIPSLSLSKPTISWTRCVTWNRFVAASHRRPKPC
jgi:hypothetical protein